MRLARRSAIAVVIALSLLSQACGASDLSKLHDTLNKTAKTLNAAAKTNHAFYEGGIYGAVGSPVAIEWRQKGATAVHDANEKLIVALNLAKGLTAATFEQGKLAVLAALAEAAKGLSVGNTAFDLVLQSVATLITQAVAFIQAFQARDLQFVLPVIRGWEIAEVNV